MKSPSFFRYYWAQPINRVIMVSVVVQLASCHWSSQNYFCWAVYTLAQATQSFACFYSILWSHRSRRVLVRRDPEMKFWRTHCWELAEKIQRTPDWDQARQIELFEQFKVAAGRHNKLQHEVWADARRVNPTLPK